jgi:hypothetical protein
MMKVLGAAVNGVATRAIPQMILKDKNVGIVGYLANGIAGLGGAWVLSKVSPGMKEGALIGAGVALVQRIVSDFGGGKFFDGGMSGDLDFDLGFYVGNNFPLPTAGVGPWLLNPGISSQPMQAGGVPGMAVAPIVAAGTQAGQPADEPGRWSPRWTA